MHEDEFEEIILISWDDGKEIELREISQIEYAGKIYVCAEILENTDILKNGNLLILELEIVENKEHFSLVADEKILNEVFSIFSNNLE